MKTKSKLFFWVLALSVFFAACDKSNNGDAIVNSEDAIAEEPITNVIEIGTVSLNAFVKDVIEVSSGKPPTLGEIESELILNIYNADGLFSSGLYNEFPELIELPPGNYSYVLVKPNPPLYGADGTFVVTSGINTDANVEISLMGVATTVNFSADIQSNYPLIAADASIFNYSDGYSPAITVHNWTIAENGSTNYFSMDEYESNLENFVINSRTADLGVGIQAIHPTTGEEIRVTKIYSNVVANEHYNITVEYSSSDGSIINLNITLGDENVIDDTITFPN